VPQRFICEGFLCTCTVAHSRPIISTTHIRGSLRRISVQCDNSKQKRRLWDFHMPSIESSDKPSYKVDFFLRHSNSFDQMHFMSLTVISTKGEVKTIQREKHNIRVVQEILNVS